MSLETHSFEFGEFLLDAKEKVLLRNGKPLQITPKAFQLLQILVKNHGHLVEREELLNTVWADSFVEEGNLTFTIRMIRKILGDSKQNPRFIETVPKRGYRFIAEIKVSHQTLLNEPKTENVQVSASSQKPYFLIAIAIISLIGIFGVSFVWVREAKVSLSKQPVNLTTNGKITIGSVSPDGKKIVFAQKESSGESLWFREIGTENQTQILPAQAVEFVGLSVSPANDYAYYSVFSKNSSVSTLSRIALNGGNSEPLSEIATDASVSFSPDGKRFAFTDSLISVKETYLKIADADGSNQKVLTKTRGEKRMFPTFLASPVAWSPDGETIACAIREIDENGASYRILLVNPNDGSEKYLSEKRWDLVENIVWKNNDNLALINSEPDSPSKQIWLISKKTGEARQLSNDLNNYQWLSASNGNLFAVQKNVQSSLSVAEYQDENKTLQTKQIFSESGTIKNLEWSTAGKIFYNSWQSGKNEIWQINPDGTTPRQLTTNSNLIYDFAVSPTDGTLVFSALQKGASSLFTADSKGQNIDRLTNGINDFLPRFTSDGKTVIFQSISTIPTLWRVSLDKSQPPTQLTGYAASHPSISTDNKTLAYHFMDYNNGNQRWRLGLMNLESGKLLNKLDFPFPIVERKTAWHPTNQLLTMTFTNGENASFLLLSVNDGKYSTIENIGKGKISSFAWSPDGNRLAFVENHEKSDMVLLNAF